MEIAFLRAILRSDAFPPHDPWLSGYAISYYYFGYVIMAMLTKVSNVPASIAFNLGIATLFALTCAGSYSLVYNLLGLRRRRRTASTDGDAEPRGIVPHSLVSALTGPLLMAVTGNLQAALAVLHSRGIGSAAFWRWLDLRSLNQPPPALSQGSWVPNRFFWWWDASRVLRDTAPWGDVWEVIDEFPAFSFILGDMHPHVLGLPFVLLAIALGLALYTRTYRNSSVQRNPYRLHAGWPFSGWEGVIYAICLGGLGFLNTWDFPIYLALVAGAFGLALWQGGKQESVRSALSRAAALFVGLLVAAVAMYLPFWMGFQSQASGVLPNLFNATRPVQFFVMFGPLLTLCGAFVASRARRARVGLGRIVTTTVLAVLALWTAMGLALALVVGLVRAGLIPPEGPMAYVSAWLTGVPMPGSQDVPELRQQVSRRILERPLRSWTAYGLVAGIVAMGVSLSKRLRPAGLTGALKVRPAQDRADGFALLLVALGALLAAAVEFVYLNDVFGTRMNTVFKFYFQTWVLWATAGAYALATFSRRRRVVAERAGAGSAWIWPTLRTLGVSLAWIVIAAGLVYTALAIPARAAEYGGPLTLDGAAHLAQRDAGDYAAISWLNDNVAGAPVVVEAPGAAYAYEGRISAHTGLPTVLGWSHHEYQWRGTRAPQSGRERDIETIYSSVDVDHVVDLLDAYDVTYVIVGDLERSRYTASGLRKFATAFAPVFESASTSIYMR